MAGHAADLHLHSTASDGDRTPAEVAGEAAALGLRAFSLTDHDTIDGLAEARQAADVAGITFIPGVEVTMRFTLEYFTGSLHLLVYFTREMMEDRKFTGALREAMSKGRGSHLVAARVERINRVFGPGGETPVLSRPLREGEIHEYADNATRRHFALALSQRHGLSKDQVTRLIGNDSPAYVPSGADPCHIRPVIARWPVVASLAHPAAGSFPGESHYREVLPPLATVQRLMPEFLDPEVLGIHALEVHYPGHTPDHERLLLDWADSLGLLVTGGSDAHDATERPMGAAGMDDGELDALLSRLRQR